MNEYFADLHIHIGRTASGKPVKITGAKSLTLQNIIRDAAHVKGLDMISIIDCHVPEVIQEIERLIELRRGFPCKDGGIRFGRVTLILGSEVEIYDDSSHGPIHVLTYFPDIEKMKMFSAWLNKHMKNVTLSSQRIYVDGKTLQTVVKQLDGLFVPAHVFTPFKSLYGKGVQRSLTEVFDRDMIDAVELGLSSDTLMADQITELHHYPFLSNSDAHSLSKMAREYQKLKLEKPTFLELKLALRERDGRKICANYGLNPKLGKYYRTTCEKCFVIHNHPDAICSNCGHSRFTKGVYERLRELKGNESNPRSRPPYIHQVPLEYIPGIGPKTMKKLRDHFHTEMNVIHNAALEELNRVIPEKTAKLIMLARVGQLEFVEGGGGKYGRVKHQPRNSQKTESKMKS